MFRSLWGLVQEGKCGTLHGQDLLLRNTPFRLRLSGHGLRYSRMYIQCYYLPGALVAIDPPPSVWEGDYAARSAGQNDVRTEDQS